MEIDIERAATANTLIAAGFDEKQAWQMSICANKIAYSCERDARRVAKYQRHKYHHKQVPYQCSICGNWHLRTTKELTKR